MAMKIIIIFAAAFTVIFSYAAEPITLEEISPHFSTNTPILWQAPMDHLPKNIWTYKIVPRVFSAATISNAVILAGFQDKGFPKPSTNRIIIWADHSEHETMPPYFSVLPDLGQISFTLGDRTPEGKQEIFKTEAVERGWKCLLQLGVDRDQFLKTNAANHGTGGVFLPRIIDGIPVQNEDQGFQLGLGRDGRIFGFYLLWPDLERDQNCQIVSPQELIACIRAFKTPSLPVGGEADYFGRIKNLAKAKKVTITKITPYYGAGVYGQAPINNEPIKIVTPIAELEVVADFGSSHTTFKLLSPMLSAEVARLLK